MTKKAAFKKKIRTNVSIGLKARIFDIVFSFFFLYKQKLYFLGVES